MQYDILEFLYSYWFIIFIFFVVTLVILGLVIVRIVMTKIQTKLFIIKSNTLEMLKAKEDTDGTKLRAKGYIVSRKGEPKIFKKGFSIWRVFFVREGEEKTLELLDIDKDEVDSERVDWQVIFESEAIRQAVKGIVSETTVKLIQILGYMAMGSVVTFILLGLTGKI